MVLQLFLEISTALLQLPARLSNGPPGRRSREWLRPPSGAELIVPDGSIITGIIIVADNRPVVMVAAKHTPPQPRTYDASPLEP